MAGRYRPCTRTAQLPAKETEMAADAPSHWIFLRPGDDLSRYIERPRRT